MNYKLLGKVSVAILLTQSMFACTNVVQEDPEANATSDMVGSSTQTNDTTTTLTESSTQTQTDTVTNTQTPTDSNTQTDSTDQTQTDTVTNTQTPTDSNTQTDSQIEFTGVKVGDFYVLDSGNDGNLPENTLDDSTSTKWASAGVDQWIQYAWETTQTVYAIDIAFSKGDERTAFFDIQTSLDGITWTDVYSGMSNGLTTEFETFDINNTDANFIRINTNGNSTGGSNWNAITKVDFNFSSDPIVVIPTDTATQTDTDTMTQTQTDITTDFYPSDIIPGIVDWKITLPVDSDGNDSTGATLVDDRNNSATEIKDENLIGYEYLPYFYASDDEVFFRAHAGGATTSGSKYPRSELRQRVGGGDGYWSVEDYQYLAVELRVTAVTSVKPEVSVVQIHGPENEPLRVQYSTSEGIYYIWNEDNTVRGIDFDYELGQRLFVTVTVKDESIFLTLENLDTGDTFSDDWVSGDATGYFKVGTYTQSSMFLAEFKSEYDDSPEPDEFAEIAVKSIDLYELFEGEVSVSGNPVYPEQVDMTETETATETATETMTETNTQTDTDIIIDGYPSDLIQGLDAWKISLPVDSNGNDSSDASSVDDRNTNSTEIKDENLINYDFPPYFYAQNNEVFFRAHAGGATTSGSKYPRSELRQRVGGGDNYWSVDNYQFLAVELRVTAVTSIKPEVSVVQIHGPENEPLRVQYSTKDGIYYIWNEDNTVRGIDFDYELGQRLFVTVTVRDGSIYLTLENLDNGSTFSDDWVSGDSTGYFKVGTYTQSSMFLAEFKTEYDESPTADEYAEIAVKSIDLYESFDGEVKTEGNPELP